MTACQKMSLAPYSIPTMQTDMRLQEFERVLINGRGDALRKFGRNEYCVVVDWSDDAENILRAVQQKLPDGYWRYQPTNGENYAIERGGRVYHLDISEETDPEVIVQSINRVLSPEFEMRVFLPTVSDTISLLLRSADWWSRFEAAYPKRLKQLFVTINERIKQTKK